MFVGKENLATKCNPKGRKAWIVAGAGREEKKNQEEPCGHVATERKEVRNRKR